MAQLKNPLAERALALGLIGAADLKRGRAELGAGADDARLLEWLVKQGLLTKWQAAQLEAGRTQNLNLAHYRLLAPLGAGGMGSVYRALDTKLNRQVAVKVLPPRQATPQAISRFRREAFVALQMRHDNVVTSFELAQHGTVHFLVMELVDGRSLSAHLAKQGRLNVREAARIGHEVAIALEHAHEQGIIHRDIKPSNILLSRDGHVKVADMGLAKFFGPQAQDGGPETRTGQFMGTIDYCSPEQAVDAKRADIRSDIYSLGCTLYHCLTGEPPFAEGTEVQRIMAHIELLPSSIRLKNHDVPPAFAELIEKRMLAKDPGDRFQTPAEAAQVLAPWVKGEGTTVNPWAGLESLDGLLEVAAQAPRVDAPRATPESQRDTARKIRPPATRRGIKLGRGAKGQSVLGRPLGWAAAVLAILGVAVGASLWWPRTNYQDAPSSKAQEDLTASKSDQASQHDDSGSNGTDKETAPSPPVKPVRSPTRGFVRRSPWKVDEQKGWEAHIWDLSFSPDGQRYLAAGDSGPRGVVRLYDVATDQLLKEFETGKEVWFANAKFVNNDLIATAYTQDRNIDLWDAVTGNLVGELQGHIISDVHVVVSHNGRYLVSYAKDNSLRLWDVDQRRELWNQDTSGQEVARVVFSPDDNLILTSGGDHVLRIRELKSGREVATLERQATPYCGEFSPDSKQVLSWCLDGRVRLWEVSTSRALRTLEVSPNGARRAWFLQDGRQILTWGKDLAFQVWDAVTGQRLRDITVADMVPPGWQEACVSPDSHLLLVANGDAGDVRVLDVESGTELYRAAKGKLTRPKGFIFSPDGRYVAAGSFRDGVYLIEFPVPWTGGASQTPTPPHVMTTDTTLAAIAAAKTSGDPTGPKPPGLALTIKHDGPVYAVAVSADGSTLMTGSLDKTARLWSAADGTPRGSPLTHEGAVLHVSLSPTAGYAATLQFAGNRGLQGNLWRLSNSAASDKPLQTLQYGRIAFNADGSEAAAHCMDANGKFFVRRYHLAQSTWRDAPLTPQTASLLTSSFSPDLRLLAESGQLPVRRSVRPQQSAYIIAFNETLNGKAQGQHVRCQPADGNAIQPPALAFHPDGHALAIADASKKLRIVHVPSGRLLHEFEIPELVRGLRGLAPTVAFHPFGDVLALTGAAGLELRDAETGEIRGPRFPLKSASSAAFTPDGSRVFVGGYDKTAQLWELDSLFKVSDKGALPPDDKRVKWVYKNQWDGTNSGSFRRSDDGTWTETKDSGGGKNLFAEWKRNSNYVLLFDRGRRMFLRCYDDHIDIFNARKGWGLLYKGSWAKP
jgi:eukaryotic-like serine/threonine-protein kinase